MSVAARQHLFFIVWSLSGASLRFVYHVIGDGPVFPKGNDRFRRYTTGIWGDTI
jgi:hypothetical protein